MLVENIVVHMVDFILGLLSGLSNIDFLENFETTFNVVFEQCLDIVSWVYYFLPVSYVVPLFAVIFGIIMFRIIIALVKLILEFIPFM